MQAAVAHMLDVSSMVDDQQLSTLAAWLGERGIGFEERVPIARYSQIKAGGTFRLVVSPKSEDELGALLRRLSARGLPYKVIGNLSNVLFRDGDIRTVGISTWHFKDYAIGGDGIVTAGAGALLPTVARRLVKDGYKGFAGLVGVPASIGGAVFMNASCYGDATSDYLVDVRCVNRDGEFRVFEASALDFSWRHSAFHDRLSDWLVVSARFKPQFGDTVAEREREQKIKQHRREYQENKLPNLGSTFATTDIYSGVAHRFPVYRALLIGVRLISRFSGANRHHHYAKMARWLTMTYFGLKGSDTVDFSEFTFNCVVNRRGANADDLIEFVLAAQKAIKACVPLEIELLKDIQ